MPNSRSPFDPFGSLQHAFSPQSGSSEWVWKGVIFSGVHTSFTPGYHNAGTC